MREMKYNDLFIELALKVLTNMLVFYILKKVAHNNFTVQEYKSCFKL